MIFDELNIASQRKKTPEGYLSVPAIFASVEVLDYTWPEPSLLGLGVPQHLQRDGKSIKIFRPAETLFARQTIDTFSNKPVTVEHMGGVVNASNYKSLNVGVSTANVTRKGESLVGEIIIMDAQAIADLENGKRYISLGYSPDIDWTPGDHPIYGHYDGVQKSITGNHVTLTERPRSRGAKVFDNSPLGENKGKTMKKKLYGIEIEIPEAVAEVFDSAVKADDEKRAAMQAEIDTVKGAAAMSAKKIEELEKRIATVTDCAYLDSLAKDRLAVIEVAKSVAPKLVTDSLSTDEIKRSIVEEKIGKLDNASADFVNGAYASICKMPKIDTTSAVTDALNRNNPMDVTLDSLHDEFSKKMNKGGN